MPNTRSNDPLKAALSVEIVCALIQHNEADTPYALAQAIDRARARLPGWRLHVAVQFITGKRFASQMSRITDKTERLRWAIALVIARDVARHFGLSGAVPKAPNTDTLELEAHAMLEQLSQSLH